MCRCMTWRAGIPAAWAVMLALGLARGPARGAEPSLPIALVNVDRIFKTHQPFQKKLEPLKAEAREFEQQVQVRQAELDTVLGQLRRAAPGSPEQQKLQLQLVKLQTELQQFVNNGRQELQKKEAALYLSFFRRVDAEIARYAKAHGVKLVIRQPETSLEENQPLTETLKALNRGILYEEGLDITEAILRGLEASPDDRLSSRPSP
jgi:Skp family chaperone for outer membrane proteins